MVEDGGNEINGEGLRQEKMARAAFSHMLEDDEQDFVPEGDRFFEAGYKAAVQAGCEFLFEVPPVLLERNADRAAAIRCERDGLSELFFLVFDAKRGSMMIMEEDRVPDAVLDFTLSYAGVLNMIAADGGVSCPPLH